MMSDREASQSAEPGCGARPDRSYHLQSLSIEGFRGIKELSIPRLGRATLLAGRNGVGKTTVLAAVRGYASRARRAASTAGPIRSWMPPSSRWASASNPATSRALPSLVDSVSSSVSSPMLKPA